MVAGTQEHTVNQWPAATDGRSVRGPLANIRVLDLTQFILGPVATQILGDMGADVIKIETPQGDANRSIGPARHPGMAALFVGMNRNKRSVTLNLKHPQGKEALLRLVDQCDVFVHSMRPDAALRAGLADEDLRQRNPRMVHASAPGYRSDGPLRNKPAYDDVIQGESGIADLNRLALGTPRYVPTVLADKFCGHVLASSISMALFHRERTGEGQCVEVPMLETMLSFNLIEHLWEGAFDDDQGGPGYTRALMPSRRPFATKDGHICLMATSDNQWQSLFKAMECDHLCTDPRFASIASRSAHFEALYRSVEDAMRLQSTDHWIELLGRYDVPHGAVRALADLDQDPYLAQTGFFHRYVHPLAGALVTPAIPVRMSASPGAIRNPPPLLGEHTHAVLSTLGYSSGQIEAMRQP